jgi:hypothetical protein
MVRRMTVMGRRMTVGDARCVRGCVHLLILSELMYHVARSILLLDSKLIEADHFTQVAT